MAIIINTNYQVGCKYFVRKIELEGLARMVSLFYLLACKRETWKLKIGERQI